MTIKLIVLKSGETLITEAKQLVSKDEEKVHSYIFTKPQKIRISQSDFEVPVMLLEDPSGVTNDEIEKKQHEVQISLSPWILLTDDEDIHVQHDWVVTICDPVESLKKMYEEKIGG